MARPHGGLTIGLVIESADVAADVGGHVGMGEQAGHDRVHLDPVRAPLDGERLGQILHTGLRGRAVREAGTTRPGVRRPDVDHRPPRAREQVTPTELATAQEGAVERDIDDGAPRVRRHVLGRNGEVGRGVVHEHGRHAEPLGRRVEHRRDRRIVADVTRPDDDGAADRLDRDAARLEMLRLTAGNHDRSAEPGELGCDRLAEPGATPGHDDARAVVGAVGQRTRARLGWWREADRVGHRGSVLQGRTACVSFRCSGAAGLRTAPRGARRRRRCG